MGIVRIIQSLGDAGALFEYFRTLRLPRMLQLMADNGMFVAGSFVTSMINTMEDNTIPFAPNDIDIWIPCQDTADGERKLLILYNILVPSHHYHFPKTIGIQNHYGRLGRIATLITNFVPRSVSMVPLLKIQAILLTPDNRVISAHQKAFETVRQFDFNICKAFYVDFHIHAIDTASIQQTAFARIGVDNDGIQKQSIHEWIRTEARMRKYIHRGYMFQEASSLDWWTFLKHVLVTTFRLHPFMTIWCRSILVDNNRVHRINRVVVNANVFPLFVDMNHPLPKLYVKDSEMGRFVRLSWGPYAHEYRVIYVEPVQPSLMVVRMHTGPEEFTRYMTVLHQRKHGAFFHVEYEENVIVESRDQQEELVVQHSFVLNAMTELVHGDIIIKTSLHSNTMRKM